MWKQRHLERIWLRCQPKIEYGLLLKVYLQCIRHYPLKCGEVISAVEWLSTEPGRAAPGSTYIGMWGGRTWESTVKHVQLLKLKRRSRVYWLSSGFTYIILPCLGDSMSCRITAVPRWWEWGGTVAAVRAVLEQNGHLQQGSATREISW